MSDDAKDDITKPYVLLHPITVTQRVAGGEERSTETTTVTLRRAKGKDLRLLDKYPGKMAQSLALIQHLGGLTMPEIDAMDAEDISALGERVAAFLPEPQQTGETSSET